jgi:hypothetical protein
MPKYNSIDTIPAKVFFEILKSKNFQLLKPKPKEKGLEELFMSIYDEFFIKSDNPEANRYLELNKEISFLQYKIATLKQALHFYFYNRTTKEMREEFAKSLKDGFGIELNLEVTFIDEVQRVLSIEIGIIENDLNLSKIEFESMIKGSKSKDYDYYDELGILSQVLPNNSLLKEEMTLAVYVSLEKLANKVVEQQNKKK